MAIDSAPADGPPKPSGIAAPPGWPWRRTALFLASAGQLITISALVGADPTAATWPSVLLAVAPAPLAAAAAFAPAPANLLPVLAGFAAVFAGAAGGGHPGRAGGTGAGGWDACRGRPVGKRAEQCLVSAG
jgi:hypothetical protein